MNGDREFRDRLGDPRPLLLDGATGTELERRGARAELPLWSTHALLERPELIAAIHADYVAAGAELLTANTFRTQERTLARAGLGARAAELTRDAVSLAREAAAAAPGRIFVLGSAPPLEDCYRPDLVPDDAALAREHALHARNLAAAGVDAIWIETHNCVREAVAAARAARATGLPAAVCFVCGAGARLLSGEPLAAAVGAVQREGVLAVGVNCLPPSQVPACLDPLRACGAPFAIYANLGAPDVASAPRSEECTPEEFAAHARRWIDAGARVIGGCCGTTPAHLQALAGALRDPEAEGEARQG